MSFDDHANDDPFASRPKIPSVSWKDAPVNTVLTIEVEKPAETVKYGKWPDGNEKNNAVITGVIKRYTHDPSIEGETRSVWAAIPSSLFIAIRDAQRDAGGQRIGAKSILHLKVTGYTPVNGNMRRDFAGKHEPPAADAFSDDEIPF